MLMLGRSMPLLSALPCFLILINLATFGLFWWDKAAARQGKRRIRESRLLAIALLGGSPGALIAQQALRHKTRKEPFRTRLLLIAALHITAFLILYVSSLQR